MEKLEFQEISLIESGLILLINDCKKVIALAKKLDEDESYWSEKLQEIENLLKKIENYDYKN